MSLLRKLSYQSGIVSLVRACGLSDALREFYYRRSVSKDGSCLLKVGNVETRFYIRNALDLRTVEKTFLEESDFLEALTGALRPGDVYFDVGSNLGQFVIPIAKIVGSTGLVVAFEPEKRVSERLRSHLTLNGLQNVRVFQKALGERSSPGRLFSGGYGSSSLLPPSAGSGEREAEEIEIVQGDALVGSESLPVPRALKIDVEGFEYSVLRGLHQTLANPACEMLCCEIHLALLPPQVTAQAIVDIVESAGFRQISQALSQRDRIHLIARKRAEKDGHPRQQSGEVK